MDIRKNKMANINDTGSAGAPSKWRDWRAFFEKRAKREFPPLDLRTDYSDMPASLARSLAVFQLGESGGGTVVEQALFSKLPGVDCEYAEALGLFVEEEHRHANILAMCVRLLGGRLIQRNWTARLFVLGRRLMGLRLKILVLLAAEVVGICYYSALAAQLRRGPIQRWLNELVADERSHLEFHCCFLRSQVDSAWKRRLFVLTWRAVMYAAGAVVMIDHRETLRDMQIDRRIAWERWMSVGELAERLVVGEPEGSHYRPSALLNVVD